MSFRFLFRFLFRFHRVAKGFAPALALSILAVSLGEPIGATAPSAALQESTSMNLARAESQDGPSSQLKSVSDLPPGVRRGVIRDALSREDVSLSDLRIVAAEQQTWPNGCLGLGRPDEGCTLALVSGWRVVVTNGRDRTWIYRTDSDGSSVRLETGLNVPNRPDRPERPRQPERPERPERPDRPERQRPRRLPNRVERRVYQFVAELAGTSRLRVMDYRAETWSDSCFGIPSPAEICAAVLTEGWEVEVTDGEETWVVRTDAEAQSIRLVPDQTTGSELPAQVRDRVFAEVDANRGASGLEIVRYEDTMWPGGCLGLPRPGEVCTQALVPGWRVVVTDGVSTWTYRTDQMAERIRLESETEAAQLPDETRDRILRAAAEASNRSPQQIEIVDFEQQIWGGCYGLGTPGTPCTAIAIPGWKVIASDGIQHWVFHTNRDGTEIRLNQPASLRDRTVKLGLFEMERRPQVGEDHIFSSVTSGGIGGWVTHVQLTRDGRVVRYASSPRSEPSAQLLRRLTPAELRQFQAVLANAQINAFDRVGYEPVRAGADTQTVTFLTQSGYTTRYDGTVQNQLPEDLQTVIQAWQAIVAAR
jgi:hypothetical protein